MNPQRRTLLAALGGFAVAPVAVRANLALPAEVNSELPGAKLLGSGRLTFLGLHIYDARLWTADEFAAERFDRHALALELQYARTLYGRLIAERSLEEMKRQGGFTEEQGERWLASMKQAFPDVNKGDRITGVQRPGESTRIFVNGTLRGELRDAEFTRRFFGIWLAPQTSEPKLRQSLLGPALARS
jgi:hypothetical protein